MSEQNSSDGRSVVPFVPRPRNGSSSRSDGTRIRSLLAEVETEPELDLAAVAADDELIDSLRAGSAWSATGPASDRGYNPHDHVAVILAAWKAEVDADPIPDLIDAPAVTAALATTLRHGAQRRSVRARRLAPVAAVVATVVLGIGGVSVGSAAAEPDTLFWPVSRVLFHARAASIEAADRTEQHIARAKTALTQGRPAVAAQELRQAQADLGQVRPQEGHADLAEVQSFLVAKAVETPPGSPADLQAPLRSDPDRTVPSGAALTDDPDPSVPVTPASTLPAGRPVSASVSPGPSPVSAAPPHTAPAAPPVPGTGSPVSAATADPVRAGSATDTPAATPPTATATDPADAPGTSAVTTTSGLGTSGPGTSGLDTSGPDTSELGTPGLDTADSGTHAGGRTAPSTG